MFSSQSQVTIPYADGVRGGIWDAWQGSKPSEVVRYASNGTTPISGVLHANARRRALGSVVDGLGTQSWLTDGCQTACEALTAMGYWWGVYSGKFGYPSFAPTNVAPHSWAADISDAEWDSISNWRSSFAPFLDGGGAFICIDAAGGALSTDPEKYFQTMLESPGNYAGAGLLGAGGSFSGLFSNSYARRVHVEAVANMDTTSWASSWVANYDVFEDSVGDATQMQVNQCVYPPIVLCVQVADADDTGSTQGNKVFLYNKAMELLAAYPTIYVAVKYTQLKDAGLDMAALIDASDGTPSEEVEDGASVASLGKRRPIGNPGWVLRSPGFRGLR